MLAFLALTITIVLTLWISLTGDDPRAFQPGPLTYAHHQYEIACDSCHKQAWEGNAGLETQCKSCHEAELAAMNDAHGKKKFADPRNAGELDIFDATQCLNCHKEHAPEQTHKMAITQPKDFCVACHQEVFTERPTHKNADANSCSNAGCHNYHDASTLHENFLSAHQFEAPLLKKTARPKREVIRKTKITADVSSWPESESAAESFKLAIHEWNQSEHAFGHAQCTDCHKTKESWQVADAVCADCHERALTEFSQGHHGMRQLVNKPNIKVSESPLAMLPEAKELLLSCKSCHKPHVYSTRFAEAESCLSCHNDEHSRQWKLSKHASVWQESPDQGASCATCHLPRQLSSDSKTITVQHNQSLNLRPNDKMLKSVCMNCHGLEYAMSALADPTQIQSNFSTPANNQHQSMIWVRERTEQNKEKKNNREDSQ